MEALDAVAVENGDLFEPRLRPETLDHPRDQRAVVLDHLVLERDPDQLSLGECAGARVVE